MLLYVVKKQKKQVSYTFFLPVVFALSKKRQTQTTTDFKTAETRAKASPGAVG